MDREILKALAYAGAFPWPLTLMELSERLGGSLGDVASRMDALVARGSVRMAHGLYALAHASEYVLWSRVQQQKECAQKWTRMLRRVWWLQAVPYARAMFVSGSLALGNTEPESDWDIFVIAQSRRLYTARAGLLCAAWMMGRLRTKRMRAAPDRFCFNHLITTDSLAIRHRSIFVAHALAELIPMHDPHGFLPRLWDANHWIADYVPQPWSRTSVRRSLAPSRTLGSFRWSLECVLNTFIGSLIERGLRVWMQRRIVREPATHAPGGRIVADNRELEFHPRSFEVAVLARYNALLARLGLSQYAESDSGLTR